MWEAIRQFLDRIELMRHNEYTMENYLRKKGSLIGKNNRIFVKDFGSEPYLIKIGNHCVIALGVRFITHDGGAWIFREEVPGLHVCGKIEIKDNCFVGMDSIIMENVTVGPSSVVAAGSVVTKDVPPNTVVAGVPARIICSTEEYKQKCISVSKALNLKGPREEWKKQLMEYFWGKEKAKR